MDERESGGEEKVVRTACAEKSEPVITFKRKA